MKMEAWSVNRRIKSQIDLDVIRKTHTGAISLHPQKKRNTTTQEPHSNQEKTQKNNKNIKKMK